MGSSITVKNLNDTEYLAIKGAGGGGDDGSENTSGGYTNRPDSLRSTDSFEILLGLGSGRWKGLVDGLKSLYINDVPLTNTDGTSNFKEVSAIFADGDPAQQQTVTFKLGGGGGVTGINTALSNTNASGTPGPWIVGATTTPNADFVDFRFVVNQLYHSMPTGIDEATATVEIQMRPQGAATWYNPLITPGVPTTYNPGTGSTPVTPVPVSPTEPPPPASGTPTQPTPVPYYPETGQGPGSYVLYQREGSVMTNLEVRRPNFDSELPSMRGSGGGDDPESDPNQLYTALDASIDYTSGSDTSTPLPAGSPGYVTISGKTMSTFVKELRVSVPKTGNYSNKTWEVRARLLEPAHEYINANTDDQEEILRTITFESITAVIKQVLGFDEHWKGLVWMQVVGNASDQLSGFPSIRGIYDTKIVKVPPATVYNPTTRQYTASVWDGTFISAYSNDPAWCIKDLIEDSISGIAAISPGATLDKWDALDASKYCSALVPDGRGGTHPRYSMNFRLDNEVNAQELIQYMAGAFNGLCVDTGGGKWKLRIDKPETPVATYTLDNIVGDFQYSHTDIGSRFNDITLTFLNEDLNYQEDRLRVYDSDHISRYGRKPTTIVAVGATNRQEVLRRGIMRLRTSLNETKIVKFTTNRQGKLLEPLQTIFVADQGLGYLPPTGSGALADTDPYNNRTTSRISSMNGARDQITLGRTVRLEPNVTYTVKVTVPNSAYNPDITTQPASSDWRLPTIVTERTLTNSTAQRGDVNLLFLNSALPANTPPNAVIALSATGMPTLPVQYRIIDLQPSDQETVGVTAMLVDSGKYTAADNGTGTDIDAWIQTGRTGGGATGGASGENDNAMIARPTVPTWGMFTFTEFMNAGQKQRLLTVNWIKPHGNTTITKYKLQHKVGDATWEIYTIAGGQTSKEFVDPVPGRHDFRVTAYDIGGAQSRQLLGSYLVPALAAGIGIPHSYGLLADRPTTNLVVGQLYTVDQGVTSSFVVTYKWTGTEWLIVSTAGADINGGGTLADRLLRWGGSGSAALIDSGDVSPSTLLTRETVRTNLGTAAAITNQGALATKSWASRSDLNFPIGENLITDGSFENSVPAWIDFGDGGIWYAPEIIVGSGAADGNVYVRLDSIGSHSAAWPEPFVAKGTSVLVSIFLKDSGVQSQSTAYPGADLTRPIPVRLGVIPNLATLSSVIWMTYTGSGFFEPSSGSGWVQYDAAINGLTPGTSYYPCLQLSPFIANRKADIDGVIFGDNTSQTFKRDGDFELRLLGAPPEFTKINSNSYYVGPGANEGNYAFVYSKDFITRTARISGVIRGAGTLSFTLQHQIFSATSNDLTSGEWGFYQAGTGNLSTLVGTGVPTALPGPITAIDGTHLAVEYDGLQVKYYVNGVLQRTADAGTTLATSGVRLRTARLAKGHGVDKIKFTQTLQVPDLNSGIFDSGAGGAYATVPRTDVRTSLGTSAAITGQGTLATKSAAVFGTDLQETAGGTTATLSNFKTSLGTASAITGQSSWATYSTITPTTMSNKTQNLDTSGRLVDYTGYEANRSYGLRSVFVPPTLSDTWTSGTVVTINIGASTLTTDTGSAINLPSGSLTNRNFSTTYYIYRTMVDPTVSTGTYGSSTTLAGAIDPQRIYLGYFITRASSGGSSPGGGGYGGTNCVVEEAFVGNKQAKDIVTDDIVSVLDEATMSGTTFAKVKSAYSSDAQCVRLTTISGYQLTEAVNTPITQPNGQAIIAGHSLNGLIPVKNKDGFRWEPIVSVEPIGRKTVRHIDLGGLTFGAGDTQEAMLYTHNQEVKP